MRVVPVIALYATAFPPLEKLHLLRSVSSIWLARGCYTSENHQSAIFPLPLLSITPLATSGRTEPDPPYLDDEEVDQRSAEMDSGAVVGVTREELRLLPSLLKWKTGLDFYLLNPLWFMNSQMRPIQV
jgi:hypothetical protein